MLNMLSSLCILPRRCPYVVGGNLRNSCSHVFSLLNQSPSFRILHSAFYLPHSARRNSANYPQPSHCLIKNISLNHQYCVILPSGVNTLMLCTMLSSVNTRSSNGIDTAKDSSVVSSFRNIVVYLGSPQNMQIHTTRLLCSRKT